ncbi:MAG: SRPBCC family protein [Candidatus Bathyarchaeota archaeon]|nr:SRPBCC family protein [Candidatus Bathyarchaeota archaeon]
MPEVEVSRVIKAPRGKVWEVVADPESMLEWWPGSESVDVLSREGNTITVRGTGTEAGRKVTMTEKWTLHPPEKIEIEILEGPVRGRTIQTYQEVPEGTKVTWSSDISFKGVLGKILGRLFVGSKLQDSTAQTLEELAKYIEAQ